ncbi:MAG TPA: inositol monophosphatase family protein [Polyangiaceae bacterium]|nr:inositol monophosphatase family protein [Polyangiaceae bacterium]
MKDRELVDIALRVAREAAQVLLGGYRTRPASKEKARRDLVTEFDTRSEDLIRERLHRETPGIAVVGEEGGGVPSGVTWYCDPLDGTMNFVHGHPVFCVSIGAMDEHGPSCGAVVAPAMGLEWWGGRGVGAFRNGAPCRVSDTPRLAESLLATGFPADRSRAPESNLPTFNEVMQHVHGVRRCGSAAMDCCFVADGTYDGYWERALHAWDIAAGCAIALAAGARLTALDGRPPVIERGHIVLTNGRIHDELVRLVSS